MSFVIHTVNILIQLNFISGHFIYYFIIVVIVIIVLDEDCDHFDYL